MKKLLSLLLLLVASTAVSMAQDTWTVAGTAAALNGTADWAPTNADNDMTSADGTNYALTVTGCTLEKGVTYKYKVVKNHAWTEAYPSSDKTFSAPETAVYTVTYTFNAETKAVDESITKTGNAGEVTHTYSIAGSPQAVFGGAKAWDEANTTTEMTLGGDGLYIWKKEDITMAKNQKIEFKIVADHSWGQAYPNDNYIITIEEDANYDLTITFNASTKEVEGFVTKKSGAVIEAKYVIAGSSEALFGTTWDGAAEANLMTKNADGTYTKTYTDVTLPEGTIEWKVVLNEATWIPEGTDNNLSFYVPEAETYDVIFTYDPTTETPASKLMKDGKEIKVDPIVKGEGWPANYGGVMMQAFFWNSFEYTQWTNLTAQADELSKYFDILWVPNSSNCVSTNSMGYLPVYWLDHRSSFGKRERYLTEMIAAYHERGTKIIEDVVLNHKSPVGKDGSYIDFANESKPVDGVTYELNWTGADICQNDDGGYIKELGWPVTGADDTGDDFSGGRDLDHTGANVQQNCITYLNYLLNVLHYDGYRLDMVKGYAAQYTKLYNEATQPEFCVGEYWDGYENIMNWVKGTGYTSAAFDFPLKYVFRDAFGNGDWSAFNSKGIAGDPNNCRYSITFVDNHDTYEHEGRLVNGVLGANAVILAMPGTPCVFLKHWQRYPIAIGNMILARKAAGITNQSPITEQKLDEGKGYIIKVQGTNGSVLVLCGSPSYDTTGFNLIAKGKDFAYYVSDNVTVEGLTPGNDDEEEKTITVNVAMAAPANARSAKAAAEGNPAPFIYAWSDSGTELCGTWPGTQFSETTTAKDGTKFWTMTFTKVPVNVIINNGEGVQTSNIEGVTHDSYYTFDPTNTDKEKNWTDISSQYYSPVVNLPECAKEIPGHVYAYFQGNKDYDTPYTWVWGDNDKNFCKNQEWPGDKLIKAGTDADQHAVWLWDGGELKEGTELPTGILFSNNGSPQTDNFKFVNGGYYDATGFLASVIKTSVKGDVNGDGVIDVADISAIISVMAGTANYDNADVNGDKVVDVADISNVIDIMAGNK